MPTPARPRVRPPRPPASSSWPASSRPASPPLAAALLGSALLSAAGGCAALPGPLAWGRPQTPPAEQYAETAGDRPEENAGRDGGVVLAGAESPAGDSAFDDGPFYDDGPEFAPTNPAGKKPGRFGRARRWLNGLTGAKGAADVSTAALPPEARRAFETARNDLDRGAHKEAAAAFKALSRRYADTAIEEDALFYRAEALYAAERFAPAQDAYDTLLDRYPSTRHLDAISKRQFEIARRWLGFPEAVASGDVKPVSYAEIAAGTPTPPPAERFSGNAPPRSSDPTLAIPVLPNFHDPTRPLFDTRNRALEGLKNVWLNDPTGALADDALFLSAGHHLRKGDYMEAARLYDILRREYPDSPHLKDAYLLGAHAREVVWQGPAYDDAGIKESRAIKESFLRLFPNAPERDRVRDSLADMAEAEAEADWSLVELFQRQGRPNAVAMYARKLLTDHPDSKAARRARTVWDALPAESRALAGPLPGAVAAVPAPYDEPSVRRGPGPAAAPEPRPAPAPAPRPEPLPASTQAPADPFAESDPFSGTDPFG